MLMKLKQHTTGIAVLSNNPPMNIAWCNVQLLADQKMKTSSVKICSTSNHTLVGKSTDFPSCICQNVHWYRDERKMYTIIYLFITDSIHIITIIMITIIQLIIMIIIMIN